MYKTLGKRLIISLATSAIGVAAVGVTVPASADVSSTHSGQLPTAFHLTGVVEQGFSPVPAPAESFSAYYGLSVASPGSCAPVIVRHQRTDNYSFTAGCPTY